MVRYESVELATHFIDKDGEHPQLGSREGHLTGFNCVPAYQSDATDNPVASVSNQASNNDVNKSNDKSGQFLTEADLSYNLEMLGDVALHEPEYSRSVENSPMKSANCVETSPVNSSANGNKSTKFPDLPSPIHGSAFRANVAIHQDASHKFIALSSNLPTTPEKNYEKPPTLGEKDKSPQNGQSSQENNPQNDARRQTNTLHWKVSLNKSPRKRCRSAGISESAEKHSLPVATPSDTDATKQTSGRSPRQKRRQRFC
jgi:hypothetical protein